MKTSDLAGNYAAQTAAALLLFQLGIVAPAVAQDKAQSQGTTATSLEDVVVYGRADRQIGTARAATEGTVGGADLTTRPVLRVAQILEVVPGMIAAQHSGSGKANQYFLRGINLDHGTDFTTYIDGVPMNFRSHGHGQGYMDLNGLIAETVDRVNFHKGPYHADFGDFALAGEATLNTVDKLDRPFVTLEGGSYGHARAVLGGTVPVMSGDLTGFAQIKTYDGPWQLPEQLQLGSMYAKYVQPIGGGQFFASLSGYYGRWQPTEQIPERAIGQGFVGEGREITCADAFCAIDPTARGQSSRWIAATGWKNDDWRATAYVQYYDWKMSSNPTFYLDDPINGDQILQHDRRVTLGGRLERNTTALNDRLTVRTGAETRYDDIPSVGVNHTAANQTLAVISNNAIKEFSLSPYVTAEYAVTDHLRINGGLRYDWYDFDVQALDPGSSEGSKSDALLSPSLGGAYRLSPSVELYVSYGRGMHSNDARGVVSDVSPTPGLVKGEGKELGARYQGGALTLTAGYWWLDTDSDLIFVGDSNSVEPRGPAARKGFEVAAFWRPLRWLAIDGQWAQTKARFLDAPGADHIPGAIESAGEAGISGIWTHWEASARVRFVGAYPLLEDDSERAPSHHVLSLRGAWKPTERLTAYVEVLNALDDNGADIEYFYTSRLPGEPADGVDGVLSRAHEPRTFRVGVTSRF